MNPVTYGPEHGSLLYFTGWKKLAKCCAQLSTQRTHAVICVCHPVRACPALRRTDPRTASILQPLSGGEEGEHASEDHQAFSPDERCSGAARGGPWGRTGRTSAFSEAYRFFDFLAIAFSLAMLYLLLREWFTPEQSLVGMLFAAATMPITFRNHYFHPWSLLEFGLFALGLLLIHRKRNCAFAVVLLLASLNRETSIFLLMAYCFVRVIGWEGDSLRVDWRSARVFGVYSALWLAIFFGLRILLGFPAPTFALQVAWILNTDPQYFRYAIHLNVLFFGFFWIVIFLGYRRSPRFIRRAAGILPFYAGLILVIGLWWEVRYLMTLYPVLIPMGLSYMYLPADT